MGEMPTIVVDTREQEPYEFPAHAASTIRRALPAGDYALAGREREVVVERKSLDDFVHTVIRERERFRNELRLLQGYWHPCIVVEGSLDDVFAGGYRSGAHPSSILGATLSIIVDYGVPVYFCSSRQLARRFVLEYLLRYHKGGADPCNAVSQTAQPPSEGRWNDSSSPQPASPPDAY